MFIFIRFFSPGLWTAGFYYQLLSAVHKSRTTFRNTTLGKPKLTAHPGEPKEDARLNYNP